MNRVAALAEIFDVSQEICRVNKLLLALTWISVRATDKSNPYKNRDLQIVDSACFVNDVNMQEFIEACAKVRLAEGEGFAGQAILSEFPLFFSNINEHNTRYRPLYLYPCKVQLHAVVAIRLLSIYADGEDFVLELFFPANLTHLSEQKLLLNSMSCTLKKPRRSSRTKLEKELIGAVELLDTLVSDSLQVAMPSQSGLSNDGFNLTGTLSFNKWIDKGGKCEPHEQEVMQHKLIRASTSIDDYESGKDDINLAPQGTKRRKLVSEVWNYFNKVTEDGVEWAICKHCDKKLVGSSKSGTTHLKNHWTRCKGKRDGDADKAFISLSEIVDLSASSSIKRNFVFDQERSCMDVARMIIKHQYPLDMVEDAFFRIFVNNLQPMFQLQSQNAVKCDVLSVYKDEKYKLCKFLNTLSSRFGLTIGLWKDELKRIFYCCLTLHFIDDSWELRKKILSFRNIEYDYDTGALYKIIKNLLLEWNIHKNVCSVTVRNEYSTDDIVRDLKLWVRNQGSGPFNGEFFHPSCNLHILQLLVQDGFLEISEVLHKLRMSFEYVYETPLNKQKFEDAVDELKLQDEKMSCQDVPSRWDSTFEMLQSALGLRKAFFLLEKIDGGFKLNPSAEEWDKASVICKCLKVFYDLLGGFYRSRHLTANIYFPKVSDIHKNLCIWEKSEHLYIRLMANRMKIKFDNHWSKSSLVMAIAVAFDPRLKLHFVEYTYNEIYGSRDARMNLKRIRNTLNSIYDEYVHGPNNESSCATNSSTLHDVSCNMLESFGRWYNSASGVRLQNSELDRYLEEPILPLDGEFDILAWWQINASKFTILGRMARDILAITMSTFVSDSAFSNKVSVFDSAFSGLPPDIIEAIMCGQDWLESPLEKEAADHVRSCSGGGKQSFLFSQSNGSNKLPFLIEDSKLGLDDDDCSSGRKLTYLSRNGRDSVEVCQADLDCLRPSALLSSHILNFYIMYLQNNHKFSSRCKFFSTFFFPKLCEIIYEDAAYLDFRKWWNNENLFEKAYVFIPIHLSSHWSLIAIYNPTTKVEASLVLHLDSTDLHNSKLLFDTFDLLLQKEWSNIHPGENRRRFEMKKLKVPQQENVYDCGIFVLYFIEFLLDNGPVDFDQDFSKVWSCKRSITSMRGKIKSLLQEMFEKQLKKENINHS